MRKRERNRRIPTHARSIPCRLPAVVKAHPAHRGSESGVEKIVGSSRDHMARAGPPKPIAVYCLTAVVRGRTTDADGRGNRCLQRCGREVKLHLQQLRTEGGEAQSS